MTLPRPSLSENDQSITEELKRLRLMVDGSRDYISLIDRGYVYRAVNRSYSDARQLEAEQMVGQSVRAVWGEDAFSDIIRHHLDRCFDGETVRHRSSFPFHGNGQRYMDVTYYPCTDDDGVVTHAVVVNHDITELIEKEAQLSKLAYFDLLTALPNRFQFNERLAYGIANAKRADQSLAVFFLDLDNFKKINDIYGHGAGDQLLCQVAKRLQSSFREIDTVGVPASWYNELEMSINRLGGDEFTLIFPGVKKVRSLKTLADRVTGVFAQHFNVNGTELHVTCSLGISVYPHDGSDSETLIKNADLAMYQAKERGKNRHVFYNDQMSERLRAATEIEARLRQAIESDALDVHYQPKVDSASNSVVGCEALARWHDPELGAVPPSKFIPIAEEAGLIQALDMAVMKKACRDIQHLNAKNFEIRLSVNFSSYQFDQGDVIDRVLEILGKSRFPNVLFEVEITESALIGNMDDTIARLNRLTDHGIHIALDDFGTGYSSLNYLTKLPISVLKLDRSFTLRMNDAKEAMVLQSIMTLADNLDLQIVAEGIESQQQLAALRRFGSPIIQGYYYSRPLPYEQFVEFVKAFPAPQDSIAC